MKLQAAEPEALFHDVHGQVAARPNDLVGPDREVDKAAAFSVLQFGAIVPPLSPWRTVRRFAPGYNYQGIQRSAPIELDGLIDGRALAPEEQADEVCRQLDLVLRSMLAGKPDPVVLFSGGVDSGLIAARLAAAGRTKSLLVNYSIGPNDPESRLAEAMAKFLDLPFKRIVSDGDPTACLQNPGAIYPMPFGDHSTPLMWELAHVVVTRLQEEDRPILDGTGADGAFGMSGKLSRWKKIMTLPEAVRRLGSSLYEREFWRRSGVAEYYLRVLRRSAQMAMAPAIIAQNPLAGIFYDETQLSEVESRLTDWISGWAGDSRQTQVIAADLALTCAGVFAQKGHSIFKRAGLDVHYPFLSSHMLAFSLAANPGWSMDEPKEPLKICLARHVPRNQVYRPKSAFLDPYHRVFHHPTFLEYLRNTTDDTGPLTSLLDSKNVSKACDLLSIGIELPPQTRNCLWAIVFLDRWYRTAS